MPGFELFTLWLLGGQSREANLGSPYAGEWAQHSPYDLLETSEEKRDARSFADSRPPHESQTPASRTAADDDKGFPAYGTSMVSFSAWR